MNSRIIYLYFMTWVSICLLSAPAGAQTQIPLSVENSISKTGYADVLIHLKERADLKLPSVIATGIEGHAVRVKFVVDRLKETAQKSQWRIVEALKKSDLIFRPFYITNSIQIENATQEILEQIRNYPEVDQINLNYRSTLVLPIVQKDGPKSNHPFSLSEGISEIRADKVWSDLKVKGEDIVVASADGGAEWSHPAIKMQYRGYNPLIANHDYFWHDAIHSGGGKNCPAQSSSPCDDTSHGTHTIGTIVGDDGLGNQIGVAPGSKWISCRNMDRGTGTLASYIECFEFFIAPYPYGGSSRLDGRPDMAPHIINNSWSCPAEEGCKPNDLMDVIQAMRSAGIMVVATAGNLGDQCGSIQNPPGYYSGDLLTVAAFNRYMNEAAYFSGRGPSTFSGEVGIDVTAPGVGIRSSVIGDKYEELDGTSMAAPHVAGAISLLWSYRKNLVGEIEQTTKLLHSSAVPVQSSKSCAGFSGDKIPNTTYGYGMLDAYNLLKSAE